MIIVEKCPNNKLFEFVEQIYKTDLESDRESLNKTLFERYLRAKNNMITYPLKFIMDDMKRLYKAKLR